METKSVLPDQGKLIVERPAIKINRAKDTINFAVIGAGGFAMFAVAEFVKIAGVKLTGVFDEDYGNALRMKEIDPEAHMYSSMEELCHDPTVDLVYIATPPYLHYRQSAMALHLGKHVICEKPAALALSDALDLCSMARQKDLLFVVNLMQRYNPLYRAVTQLIQQNVLGGFLRGFFENYASDEFLPENHWFWDENKSGGIFVEHGVHFFDMFSGWLGEGKVVASQQMSRPGFPKVWDKFQATVQYANSLVNFYHAFNQPKALDRQELRLQFERGEITLHEWVPTRLRMTGLCSEDELHTLEGIFPDARVEILSSAADPISARGHFKNISYQYKFSLQTVETIPKPGLYKQLVTAMFEDQLMWLRDKRHQRIIDQNNAINSLKIAEEASAQSVRLEPSKNLM